MMIKKWTKLDQTMEAYRKKPRHTDYFECEGVLIQRNPLQWLASLLYMNRLCSVITAVHFGLSRWYWTILFCLIVWVILPLGIFGVGLKLADIKDLECLK